TASLLVLLSTDSVGGSERGLPVMQPEGTTLDILVQAKRGFTLEGRAEGTLTITDAQETLPLQFKLRATALGPGLIQVLAFHNGIPLGPLKLTPTVVDVPSLPPGTPAMHEQPLAPVSVRLPDLSLLIEETRVNGNRAFTLRLTAADPGL